MQQLSELDASFLYLETDRTPMHIGGLYIFDASDREDDFSFAEFLEYIESRLHVAKFFRKRLVEVPLKLDHPYWVDDPEFDINKHVYNIRLADCTTEKPLTDLAADLLSVPLKRDRPLWEITFVDGLNNVTTLPSKSFAMIVKVHHSAIDPLSGEDVMGVMLDFSPSPKKIKSIPEWRPQPLPSTFKLLGGAYTNALSTPFRLASMAKDTAAATFYSVLLQRLSNLNFPPSLFSAPRTQINQQISSKRSLSYKEVSLSRVKSIKRKIGREVFINDIVCGICAEAVRNYLLDINGLPETSLIAMSPISVRSKSLHSPTGNQMAAMMISLATDEPNPAWRVIRIHENAVVSKTYSQAISAQRLTQLIPSTMTGLATRIYTEFQLAQRHKPIFNLPLTNIPGPQTPLYLNGCKLIKQVGTSPLFDGLGLSFVIISYNDTLTFSITSCPDTVEDAGKFATYIEQAINDIEEAAENIQGMELPAYTPKKLESPSLIELGSAIIEDIVSLFQNIFTQSKEEEDKKRLQHDKKES
ncbi:MAG: wax ester/triacylglycerol synthase family O-acyltransferase [Hahellaceae bacterium]|nr:wax ester/triacylglycerol synthase family O-acyltransferase [Hahellaceae bacterium]MCP5210620.1 wax ester/triacylglycerol synthase family O-acyltransferase [Hahellaceae bacterium]